MKIVCKINNINHLSNEFELDRLRKYIFTSDRSVNLDIDREYVVYGIVFWDSSPWYYLCDDEKDLYPTPFPAEFFNTVSSNLSSHWELLRERKNTGKILSSLVFKEWAENPSFYENLVDGDVECINVFKKYRLLMNQEY